MHSPPDFLIAAGLPLVLSGAKLILDIHDLTPELYASRFRGKGGLAARFLTESAEWTSCAVAHRVITTTHAFRDLLVSRGVPEGKILVLYNCPDPRSSLAAEGRSQIDRFSWDREKDKLLGLYRYFGVD